MAPAHIIAKTYMKNCPKKRSPALSSPLISFQAPLLVHNRVLSPAFLRAVVVELITTNVRHLGTVVCSILFTGISSAQLNSIRSQGTLT
ncbi:hypothetical protein BDZ45DRAFT_26687 [Acephala macrosclerotiorum]|nr:hypothetical protein BDZ45DRAFT_26687 [Acephala macrosclerotiorum]